MGLKPGMKYSLSVESDSIETVMPASQTVTVSLDQPGDIHDIVFIAIERSSTFSLAGSAFFQNEET